MTKKKDKTQSTLTKVLKAEKNIEKQEKRLAKDEKKIESTEKKIKAEEKNIEAKEDKLQKTEEKILFTVGKFQFKKKHAFDIAKIASGALLGTGLGVGFISSNVTLAEKLGWMRIILLTSLSILFCAILIYKEDHEKIEKMKSKYTYVFGRVAIIYIISIILVTIVSLILTPALPESITLIKVMFIGAFSAASGAISFNIL
jgi:hypothetical protein